MALFGYFHDGAWVYLLVLNLAGWVLVGPQANCNELVRWVLNGFMMAISTLGSCTEWIIDGAWVYLLALSLIGRAFSGPTSQLQCTSSMGSQWVHDGH